ncbi:MAG: hypothetical protein M3Z84_01455 [Actinomycetota bacterium]|nr:hypothetical protein [Actinomycetota bacterium]
MRAATVVVTDQVIPIAVEADASSGEIVRVHAWPLSADHRGRPTVVDVALTDEEILVSSPAAGGLVRIDRASSAVTIIPLDGRPGRIAVGLDAAWVSADAEDRPVPTGKPQRRPVIWEEPSPEEIERSPCFAPTKDPVSASLVFGPCTTTSGTKHRWSTPTSI